MKMFICSRADLIKWKTHYVSELPCKAFPGAARKGDYGYTEDKSKALPLSLWHMRRWAAGMLHCGRIPIIDEVK